MQQHRWFRGCITATGLQTVAVHAKLDRHSDS